MNAAVVLLIAAVAAPIAVMEARRKRRDWCNTDRIGLHDGFSYRAPHHSASGTSADFSSDFGSEK
ncbi:hypothetical protein [Sphingomonas sp. Leaf10]|uniref:hypothetical protein n=1 Tax=Sphingomonas sp. Leaf10 TaxID=1735676 RepID=UPI0006F534D2|nr:hypothetical protein [Sphingomonas sp. Leaf10]KQM37635.1 hypothetical protein ASE59_14225 [Sphingomonas sp. Leaf10]